MEKIVRECLWAEFHWAMAHATDEELNADQVRADAAYWAINALGFGVMGVVCMN